MKIVARPIEMVAWTDTKGNINPVRFKIINDDEKIKLFINLSVLF